MRSSRCLRSEKYADCSIISAKSSSRTVVETTPARYAPMSAPVTVAHSSTIATLRFVQPSRTNATLAPALVATTEMRLAPIATFIGRRARITSAGTMKTPPPSPDSAPMKPAPIESANNPSRISPTLKFPSTTLRSASGTAAPWRYAPPSGLAPHRCSEVTNRALQVQHHQQTAEADILPRGHADFDDLGVAELRPHPPKEIVIERGMIGRHFLREFQRDALALREGRVVAKVFQPRDFLFRQTFFHRRWKSCFLSSEALIERCDLEPHQLLQRRIHDAAIVQRIVELEVGLDHVGPMAQHPQHRRIRAGSIDRFHLLAQIAGQLCIARYTKP